MDQSGNIKDRENNRTSSERNLSSNTLAAAVPAEQSDFSAFWRSKRDSGKTEENQQYEDVLRSIETASQGSVDVDVPSATPSPTKRFSEVYAASTKVSCDAVRASGPVAGLGLITTDVENMSLDELEDCLDVLGSRALPTVVIQQVWTHIRHVKKIVQLHPQLGAETMLALGKIACNLSLMFLRKIANGKEVFHASAVLAEIETCDWVVLRELTQQMSQRMGSISNWTSNDIRSLGVLAAGIPVDSWSTLKQTAIDNPLLGLQPSAVKCMDTETLKAFSIEQLESFTPMAVAAISSMQLAELSDSQRSTLTKTKAMELRSLDFVIEQGSTGSSATLCLKTALLMLTATVVMV